MGELALKNSVILIVEDHLPARLLLSQWLRAIFPECTFWEAQNGEEALNAAIDRSPDIVIMDIGLPLMDGIEATRMIKTARPKVKVIMLTIHDEREYRSESEKAGAVAYVSKLRLRDDLIPLLADLIKQNNGNHAKGEYVR
jgi:DNA-binding NarL/FixJ family response regulator